MKLKSLINLCIYLEILRKSHIDDEPKGFIISRNNNLQISNEKLINKIKTKIEKDIKPMNLKKLTEIL